jgi:poly-beta-1,6-N-acetyl-D-glucosamine synthase
MGALATHRFHGEIYHQVGGDATFLLAKALHRMAVAQPRVLGGLAMLWGYAAACLAGRPRLVTRDEARYYRALLRRRLTAPAARLFPAATRR